MGGEVYGSTHLDDLFPDNLAQASVAMDLKQNHFQFHPKGIDLPTEQGTHFEPIPSGITMYDDELKEFSKHHPNTLLRRELMVDQRIVVNSKGGMAIQSTPFFMISYEHGPNPLVTDRHLNAVCTSEDDIKRFP